MKKIITLILAIVFCLTIPAHANLIDRGNGMIYDDDKGITWLQNANYVMTSGYDSDGRMNWDSAMTWADTLVFGGYDDWRLPATIQPDSSCDYNIPGESSDYNCTGSEMGHLYYTELGNSSGSLSNTDPFTNIQGLYWSSTEDVSVLPPSNAAWTFDFSEGYQGMYTKVSSASAWAVRDGDVSSSTVPEPATMLLFGSGLVGVFVRRRRKA